MKRKYTSRSTHSTLATSPSVATDETVTRRMGPIPTGADGYPDQTSTAQSSANFEFQLEVDTMMEYRTDGTTDDAIRAYQATVRKLARADYDDEQTRRVLEAELAEVDRVLRAR